MCFFCCVTLRGITYFMVTVHMVGTLAMSLISVQLFLNPPNYPDTNLSPLIMSQLPLIVASYSLLSSIFACFIFRAIDMESMSQLKLSATSFAVYQSLVLCVQLIFSLMFGDILQKSGQGLLAAILVINFILTLIYLTVLFLYGKLLYERKYGSPKLCRNSLGGLENNWGLAPQPPQFAQPSLYLKELAIPGLNLLQNHPPITRSNSEAVSITVTSTATNTTPENVDEISDEENGGVQIQEENLQNPEVQEEDVANIPIV